MSKKSSQTLVPVAAPVLASAGAGGSMLHKPNRKQAYEIVKKIITDYWKEKIKSTAAEAGEPYDGADENEEMRDEVIWGPGKLEEEKKLLNTLSTKQLLELADSMKTNLSISDLSDSEQSLVKMKLLESNSTEALEHFKLMALPADKKLTAKPYSNKEIEWAREMMASACKVPTDFIQSIEKKPQVYSEMHRLINLKREEEKLEKEAKVFEKALLDSEALQDFALNITSNLSHLKQLTSGNIKLNIESIKRLCGNLHRAFQVKDCLVPKGGLGEAYHSIGTAQKKVAEAYKGDKAHPKLSESWYKASCQNFKSAIDNYERTKSTAEQQQVRQAANKGLYEAYVDNAEAAKELQDDTARVMLDNAIILNPEAPRAYALGINIYIDTKQFQHGFDVCQKALSYSPDSKVLKAVLQKLLAQGEGQIKLPLAIEASYKAKSNAAEIPVAASEHKILKEDLEKAYNKGKAEGRKAEREKAAELVRTAKEKADLLIAEERERASVEAAQKVQKAKAEAQQKVEKVQIEAQNQIDNAYEELDREVSRTFKYAFWKGASKVEAKLNPEIAKLSSEVIAEASAKAKAEAEVAKLAKQKVMIVEAKIQTEANKHEIEESVQARIQRLDSEKREAERQASEAQQTAEKLSDQLANAQSLAVANYNSAAAHHQATIVARNELAYVDSVARHQNAILQKVLGNISHQASPSAETAQPRYLAPSKLVDGPEHAHVDGVYYSCCHPDPLQKAVDIAGGSSSIEGKE